MTFHFSFEVLWLRLRLWWCIRQHAKCKHLIAEGELLRQDALTFGDYITHNDLEKEISYLKTLRSGFATKRIVLEQKLRALHRQK